MKEIEELESLTQQLATGLPTPIAERLITRALTLIAEALKKLDSARDPGPPRFF